MSSPFCDPELSSFPDESGDISPEDLSKDISNVEKVHVPGSREHSTSEAPALASQHYMPRAPRLPGLPEPPPDCWGVWDEYRDDLDPGYRVKDLPVASHEEDELMSAKSGNTSLSNTGHFPAGLFQVASASASASTPRTPLATAPFVPDIQRDESPAFGRSDSRDVVVSKQYDIHGNVVEVSLSESKALASDLKPETSNQLGVLNLRIEFELGKSGLEPERDRVLQEGERIGLRYRVIEQVGAGAFSAAYSAEVIAEDPQSGPSVVCLKVVKNVKDYFDQGLDEIRILEHLAVQAKKRNTSLKAERIVRLVDYFYFREHLFIVTERLYQNLYEYQRYCKEKEIHYFTLGRVQKIAAQLARALSFMHANGVISGDLKPENVLFESYSACLVKIIDMGNACYVGDSNVSNYIQSRCYRAPEVILGLGFDAKVDVWSLGCVLAEIFTGYVLFQCERIEGMLARIVGIIGDFPVHMLDRSKVVDKFFINKSSIKDDVHILVPKKTSLWQRLRAHDVAFVDFVCRCLQLDPALRSAAEALQTHEFLTSQRFPDGL